MEKLINLMTSNNMEELANKARLGQALPQDYKILKEFDYQASAHIEGRLLQIESIAKALQVASLDDDSGIFKGANERFNAFYWITEEMQALRLIGALQSDCNYLVSKVSGEGVK